MGSSFVLFCSFLCISMELPWGTFGLGKAGYCTHKNVHGYGAFKGKSIFSLPFCKRQVSHLSFFNVYFVRRSVFSAAHFFLNLTFPFSAHSNFFFFFFCCPLFFAAHLFSGVLKTKTKSRLRLTKTLRLENEENNPNPFIWLTPP